MFLFQVGDVYTIRSVKSDLSQSQGINVPVCIHKCGAARPRAKRRCVRLDDKEEEVVEESAPYRRIALWDMLGIWTSALWPFDRQRFSTAEWRRPVSSLDRPQPTSFYNTLRPNLSCSSCDNVPTEFNHL